MADVVYHKVKLFFFFKFHLILSGEVVSALIFNGEGRGFDSI